MKWCFPTSKLILGEQDVHVWSASLAEPENAAAPVEHVLSPDERSRATQFVHEHHRQRYIAGRGLLRTILSTYIHLPPAELRFDYNEHGKPRLVQEEGGQIEFNLSHSHELVLYAVTRRRAVGVDLEHVRPLSEFHSIAAAFFTERENRHLRGLPPDQQLRAFFWIWTRKEAFLKAAGEGIGNSLRAVEVSTTGAGYSTLTPYGPICETDSWRLVDLDPSPAYIASLAVPGSDLSVRCMRWPQWEAVHHRSAASETLRDQLN